MHSVHPAGRKRATSREFNFDGLVGPTHNYAGLSFGNVASSTHRHKVSRPRTAVLEGLSKMKAAFELGIGQGVLPPQERPRFDVLRSLGFGDNEERALRRAAREAPELLAAVYSASPMWAANAATVCPSADASDDRVHFSAANLTTAFHRSLEGEDTAHALRRIFHGPAFIHHGPLPMGMAFADEGAANHTRLHSGMGAGLQIFVYGRDPRNPSEAPTRYPARQTLDACRAIARRHRLSPERVLFLQQSPTAIDAGVFHNDVIAVGHERILLWHEDAFVEEEAVHAIKRKFEALDGDLLSWQVYAEELTVEEAVETYLFNSQLLSGPSGVVMFAPRQVEEHARAAAVVERLRHDGLCDVRYFDLAQSMQNGGGPACLRLRVTLTGEEARQVLPGCLFTDDLHDSLSAWANRYFREELTALDLADPQLAREGREALDALTQIMGLGDDFYSFQRSR